MTSRNIEESGSESDDCSSEDETSSYDDEDSYYSSESDESMDEEYQQFVEKYGHLDFQHLNFLPKIRTKQELLEQQSRVLIENRIARTNEIIAKSSGQQSRKPTKFQKSELGPI